MINTKRIFTALLLAIMAVTGYAYDFQVDGIYYNLTSYNDAVVTHGDKKYTGSVFIPTDVKWNSRKINVVGIGDQAFKDCEELTSVILTYKVTHIGEHAFYERIYGEENPIFSIEYEGFAGNDSESSLSAKPTAKSPATITSNVGTYPINVSGGDATNYKFSYTSGVLTINKAEQTIEWNQDLSNVQVGSQVELTAKASSGLPVEYTMESNYSASLYKVGTKTYIDCVAAGQIVLRASQPGNNNYYGTPRATNAINIVGNTIADPTLTIIQGEKGLIKTQVAKGSVYTFSIEATEGWKIHSVSFNDEDITEQLDANNRFTTPNINVSATLNVVYESSPDGIASAKVSSAKILGTSSGIKVENARPNEVLKIYTIDGKLVKNQKIQSSEVNIDLPNNKIYLITLENLRVKVRL